VLHGTAIVFILSEILRRIRVKSKSFVISLWALLLVLGLSVALVLDYPAPGLAADLSSTKVEPLLLEKFSAEGQADFIVRFIPQADLSPAFAMNWQARGEFVYKSLGETAAKSQSAAKAQLDKLGMRYQTFIAGNELFVWSGTLAEVTSLASLPEVEYIRATRTYTIDPVETTKPLDGVQWVGDLLAGNYLTTVGSSPEALAWGINYTKANQFWSTYKVQGDGILVANIDTGVQYNHPALDQAYKCLSQPGSSACWSDPANICGGTPCDYNGHGTHTMGTMVADDDPALTYQAGMAPNAQWIACKGCESTSCSDFALSSCADWVLAPGGNSDNRPDVVNNSWGGGGGDPWYLSKVQAWVAAGIFPAFSAGNSGSRCGTLGSPGDYQESFASAAVNSSGTIATFSSRGPSDYGHTPYTKPNIAAPGVSVCSSIPTNSWSCSYSGTSMASPHTAGAVALLWSCNAALVGQVDATFQVLQNSAGTPPAGNCSAPPDGEGNYTYGYGYLDVLAAGNSACGTVETGTLEGTVTDEASGLAISGASVTASPGGNTTTTGPDGAYQMTLSPGTYTVTASKTGYNSSIASGVVITSGDVTTQDFTLTPQTGCTSNCLRVTSITMKAARASTSATITVKNENNKAVSQASVSVSWVYPGGTTNQGALTSSKGTVTFSLSVTAPGSYTITVMDVTKTGYTFDRDHSVLTKTLTR
jgi:subtilisin family serine protease